MERVFVIMEKEGVKYFENIDYEGNYTLCDKFIDAELFENIVQASKYMDKHNLPCDKLEICEVIINPFSREI